MWQFHGFEDGMGDHFTFYERQEVKGEPLFDPDQELNLVVRFGFQEEGIKFILISVMTQISI